MLLTLLHNVVFLAGKEGPEGQANGEMMNTWFPHVLLIFSCTASLAVFPSTRSLMTTSVFSPPLVRFRKDELKGPVSLSQET